ncbi:MAG TPA: S53 family peptidase [Pirellulales bacterium]|nr:S53 family peptidase [Pirellulales bacterium]
MTNGTIPTQVAQAFQQQWDKVWWPDIESQTPRIFRGIVEQNEGQIESAAEEVFATGWEMGQAAVVARTGANIGEPAAQHVARLTGALRLRREARQALEQTIHQKLGTAELPAEARPILGRRPMRMLSSNVAEYAQQQGADFVLAGPTEAAAGQILQWILAHWQQIYAFIQAILAGFGVTLPPLPTNPTGGGTTTGSPTVGSSTAGSSATLPKPALRCRPYIKYPDPVNLRPHGVVSWTVAGLCAAYHFPQGLPGGATIGIVELGGGWSQQDLDRFGQANHLPRIVVEDVSVDGTTNDYGTDPGADGEVALDIEVAAAAYYYCTGTMPTIKVFWAQDIASAVQAAARAGCDVCSVSWGANERAWAQQPGAAAQMESVAAAATAAGMIIFAASGDNSSSDGDRGANVDLPAACPHVIGCGGTTKTSTLEVVWGRAHRPNGAGTGGGFSNLFAAQAWQLGAPRNRGRMVPDMAANADPNTGYLVVVHGQQTEVGGTSAVAPLCAGLFAALGEKLGFVTPKLYASDDPLGTLFTDITQGSNGMFMATIGPDPCTGLGTPIGTALQKLFAEPAPVVKPAAVSLPGVPGVPVWAQPVLDAIEKKAAEAAIAAAEAAWPALEKKIDDYFAAQKSVA